MSSSLCILIPSLHDSSVEISITGRGLRTFSALTHAISSHTLLCGERYELPPSHPILFDLLGSVNERLGPLLQALPSVLHCPNMNFLRRNAQGKPFFFRLASWMSFLVHHEHVIYPEDSLDIMEPMTALSPIGL